MLRKGWREKKKTGRKVEIFQGREERGQRKSGEMKREVKMRGGGRMVRDGNGEKNSCISVHYVEMLKLYMYYKLIDLMYVNGQLQHSVGRRRGPSVLSRVFWLFSMPCWQLHYTTKATLSTNALVLCLGGQALTGFSALLNAVLTYGAETWRVTEVVGRKLGSSSSRNGKNNTRNSME